jgi:uncharacterized RDD family membrane protein YckC
MNTPEPPNPYAPPAASLDADAAGAAVVESAELASRWQRLSGALVDGLLGLAAIAPGYFGLSSLEVLGTEGASTRPFMLFTETGRWGLVAGALLVVLSVVQWTLLARRGQTLGKMAAGTRVVTVDDSPAGLLRAVVLRVWPVEILSRLPMVRWLLFVDLLFILEKDRRCLHDRLAGTKVVRVSAAS